MCSKLGGTDIDIIHRQLMEQRQIALRAASAAIAPTISGLTLSEQKELDGRLVLSAGDFRSRRLYRLVLSRPRRLPTDGGGGLVPERVEPGPWT